MKKISTFCVLAILASAGAGRADIYVRGQGIFVLPMDTPYSSGIGFGIAAGWELNPQFALELGASRWSLPSAGMADGLSLGKIAALPIELSLRARLPLGAKLNLLGDAGLGYAFHSFTIDEDLAQSWTEVGFVIEESAKSGLAAHLGAGLELVLSPGMSVDISARYYLLRSSGEWSITDAYSGESASGTLESLNLDSLTFSLGLKIGLAASGASR